MTKHTKRTRLALMACLQCGVFSSSGVPAQDRDEIRAAPIGEVDGREIFLSTDVPVSDQQRVSWLLESFDLVAMGRFVDLSLVDSDGKHALRSRTVTTPFRIQGLYSGVETEGSVVDVQLNSDMLAFPGEAISRYAKRQEVHAAFARRMAEAAEERSELDAALRAGAMSDERHRRETARLDVEDMELNEELRAFGTRGAFRSHGETFYDLGGSIREGEPYLIAVTNVAGEEGAYLLDDLPTTTNLFWGEKLEDMLVELSTRGR